MATRDDPLGARTALTTSHGETVTIYHLPRLAAHGATDLDRLPFTVKVLLENVLRQAGNGLLGEDDVLRLARWDGTPAEGEVVFMPARVLLHDTTGVPALVDLAAMRSAVARLRADPLRINPLVQADLIVDHSVQVDRFGTALAFATNVEREYERNQERYALLRWAGQAFRNFRVVPPGYGILHQVNIEYLARVVYTRQDGGVTVAYPDTLVGTDSHTTMVNGLGVLGWGVGGIEAEAVLLGQPLYLLSPDVVGMRLTGQLPEGATATDLVLTITQLLRKFGVVGRFVEFHGEGAAALSLADRVTISNMAPEYGATASMFPIDAETLRYLRMTGRDEAQIDLVERYAKEQGLWHAPGAASPIFSATLELDLATVEPSLAGPRRPQDRVGLGGLKAGFRAAYPTLFPAGSETEDGSAHTADDGRGTGAGRDIIDRFQVENGPTGRPVIPLTVGGTGAPADTAEAGHPLAGAAEVRSPEGETEVALAGERVDIGHGSVVIAAITSCTNTSNPSVMIGAGLLAKKAVERGLRTRPFVKTSLAPGSRAVTEYLKAAGLLPSLEALGFHVVGYGCTTCIGNSGPLAEPIGAAILAHGLTVAAVLSGNRNFEGRIHPLVRAAYLASPPLVVAFALAGTVDVDLTREPLGYDPAGQPVYLREIWPAPEEVQAIIPEVVRPAVFAEAGRTLFQGDERWQSLPVPGGDTFAWDSASTYVQEPAYLTDVELTPGSLTDIQDARVLAMLGDSITTDHISPAGTIPVESPAGRFLVERGVRPLDFNSYAARRGNHEVMVRGAFGNIRLRNELVAGREGGWTVHFPTGETVSIFEAATRYQATGTPLVVIAGREYGTGSSRDWAAKGTKLAGVRAVIAESYERIHRSNLVGMGVLPLQFKPGDTRHSLGLTGRETITIDGIAASLTPLSDLMVKATGEDGSTFTFPVTARLDTPTEVDYYRHGGILPLMLRRLAAEPDAAED